jgi:gamma-glutamyltranspeptidase/glutathione hydrolase
LTKFQKGGGLAEGSAKGGCASPHPRATLAAIESLRSGGNAVDAAVTAAAMLSVVAPHDCGLGGDLFAIVAAPGCAPIGLNASGRSPRGASIAAYHAVGLTEVPLQGPLSITVPGAASGWEALLARYGSQAPSEIFAPAICAARKGFIVDPGLRFALRESTNLLESNLGAREVFLKRKTESVLFQPDLARTLEHLVTAGLRDFYEGDSAKILAAGLAEAGAILSFDDLASHQAEWTNPLMLQRAGAEIFTMPPNSPGIAVLSAMKALTPGWIRSAPFQSKSYYEAMLAASTVGRAEFALAGRELFSQADESCISPNTVCVTTCDRDGLIVVLIQSLFHWFGSGVVARGTGVLLQNRGAAFNLREGTPYALQSRARPPHTLTPIIFRGPSFELASGIAGGYAQPQLQQQFLVSVLDRGLNPEAALAVPRWFHGQIDKRGECLHFEDCGDSEALGSLAAAGYRIERAAARAWYMGLAQCIARIDNKIIAASDPRGYGLAEVI